MDKFHGIFNNLEIHYFRSLRDINGFALKPVNILIGENGSGKSSLLELFTILRNGARGNLENTINSKGGINDIITYGTNKNKIKFSVSLPVNSNSNQLESMKFHLELDNKQNGFQVNREHLVLANNTPEYERNDFQLKYSGYLPDSKPIDKENSSIMYSYQQASEDISALGIHSTELALYYFRNSFNVNKDIAFAQNIFSEIRNYSNIDLGERAQIRFPQTAKPQLLIEEDGSNLVNVLQTIKTSRKYSEHWNSIKDALQYAFEDYEDIDFRPGAGVGKIALLWNSKDFKNDSFTANNLSHGTLKYLLLITICYSPDHPSLILLDEPTNHLNPKMLAPLCEAIKYASKETQFIISTHSPIFADHFSPEEIITVSKIDGYSEFVRLSDDTEKNEFLEIFSVKEIIEQGLMHE